MTLSLTQVHSLPLFADPDFSRMAELPTPQYCTKMILDLKLDKEGTRTVEKMSTTLQKLTFSWRTTLLGLASVLYGVIQTFNEPTLDAALHDQRLWMALIVAIMGFVAKDSNAHGTPDQPISPEQSAKITAVANSVSTPGSFVGAAIPGSAHLFAVLPGDPTPVDGFQDVGGVRYVKISPTNYFRS